MNDRQFMELLDHFGLSYAGYRRVRKGVKKRLVRHMQALGCRSLPDYVKQLEDDPEAHAQFQAIMSVSISKFFRDKRLWEDIGNGTLPILCKEASGPVAVWSAGCACGEEVYSLRIVEKELRERERWGPRLTVSRRSFP